MDKSLGANSGSREPDPSFTGSGPDPGRGVRTVIVQPKYKGTPIWKWVGKRFAAIAYFDAGTAVLGAELLEAGVILFVGPLAIAFAHVQLQADAFDELDAIAMETQRAETPQSGLVAKP